MKHQTETPLFTLKLNYLLKKIYKLTKNNICNEQSCKKYYFNLPGQRIGFKRGATICGKRWYRKLSHVSSIAVEL